MTEPAAIQPVHILTTQPGQNVARPGGGGNWTERIAGGTWMFGPNPRYAWTSVHDPDNEFDQPTTCISGTIINEPFVSQKDIQFTHPFGNDYEFHVAPDAAYFELVAPNMQGSYLASTKRANEQFNLGVPGVVGMEMDSGMVPDDLETATKLGDRVALWGRLIVDTAHDDFHTEIHPPLVMVVARQGPSSQQGLEADVLDATNVEITSRPFLVSQEFDHGSLWNQLLLQIAEATAPLVGPFTRIDAHPRLKAKPVAGTHFMIFKIRPPSPRRRPGDKLFLGLTITQRSGGVVFTAHEDHREPDSVNVLIVVSEDGYTAPPEPIKKNRSVTLEELHGALPGGFAALELLGLTANALLNPALAVVIARGFKTHTYENPKAISAGHTGSATREPVNTLFGNTPTNKDDSQPFPLFGSMKLEWEREPEWFIPILHMVMT